MTEKDIPKNNTFIILGIFGSVFLIVAMLLVLLVYRNKKKKRKVNKKEIPSIAIEIESNPMHRNEMNIPSVAIEMGSNPMHRNEMNIPSVAIEMGSNHPMHQKKKKLKKTTRTKKIKKSKRTKRTKKEDPEQGNWSSHQSPEGKTYFHNQVTGKTTWTDPSPLKTNKSTSVYLEGNNNNTNNVHLEQLELTNSVTQNSEGMELITVELVGSVEQQKKKTTNGGKKNRRDAVEKVKKSFGQLQTRNSLADPDNPNNSNPSKK